MSTLIDKLTQAGCSSGNKDRLCRSRGGESCAFDGAMIVLQPIADTAHLVHGPIACCGNAWEGRGTLSSRGELHSMGFTTDMGEIDIVYGSEEKLLRAIHRTREAVKPRAIFVYATCVSGLIGEDLDAVCRKAESEIEIPVIPVNAPGFVGPKNLGNRIAGEALLEHVIGTGEPPVMTHADVNLIGEYNIAGDLWLIEPLLAKAGIRILSRMTGDSTFDEITWAHRAKLNVVVCGRALINVAREMESRYGIPFVEVSFFGKTETTKALRAISDCLNRLNCLNGSNGPDPVDAVIRQEERNLKEALKPYKHLRGKKAVLYTGGVKSWSFISALRDLGIEIVAVGTKKSTAEDEEKMKRILGPEAPLVEDVTPKNLLKLLKDRGADMLIAGGRNRYLAVKEGYPFVDVNQERHTAYAGYRGLVNFAEDIDNSLLFYNAACGISPHPGPLPIREREIIINPLSKGERRQVRGEVKASVSINPIKHSPAVGAAMALQGIDGALPVIHGAQGCTFLGKVLLTRHFREPVALASSKLFAEDIIMGSEEKLSKVIEESIRKNKPSVVGVLTSGLAEIKGDDVHRAINDFNIQDSRIIHISTPDYEGGLEAGYARAVEAVIRIADFGLQDQDVTPPHHPLNKGRPGGVMPGPGERINILAGSHLTPADCREIREIAEDFGLEPVILPDLSALDGSRQGFSPLASGGTMLSEIGSMGRSKYTIALGKSMEPAARLLKQKAGVEYRMCESAAGVGPSDRLLEEISKISGKPVPAKYRRQRQIAVDTMRDAYVFFGSRKICLALEPDHAVQVSTLIQEMGAAVELAVIPTLSDSADRIRARNVIIGDLFSVSGEFDLLIANSHAESTAKRLRAPLYEAGFPVFKSLGYTTKTTIGYRGTMTLVNEIGNLLVKRHS